MNSKDRFLSLDFSEVFFDWDDNKEQRNFIKHGVRFRTAVKVFFDPHTVGREGLEHPPEKRYDVLGRSVKFSSSFAHTMKTRTL